MTLDEALRLIPGFDAHLKNRDALAERTRGMGFLDRNKEYLREMAGRLLTEGTATIGPGRTMPNVTAMRTHLSQPRDNIPTVAGGGDRFSQPPFSSGDIASGNPGVMSAETMQMRRQPQMAAANDDRFRVVQGRTDVTPERALALLQELGAKVTQMKNVNGTVYIKFEDPVNPRLPFSAQPTIRIPPMSDRHAGRPASPGEAGVLFDTASEPGRRTRLDPRTTEDEGGRPFADFQVLEETLRQRFGGRQQPEQPAPKSDLDPTHPRLLSSAAPIAALTYGGEDEGEPIPGEAQPQDGNAGRFARPIANQDRDMIEGARALRRRMSSDADDMEREFGITARAPKRQGRVPDSVWEQFARAPALTYGED